MNPRRNTSAAAMVGAQVRALREQRQPKLSQKQLAERAGMLQQTLARLESGARGVSIDDLFKLAAALNVAPVELLSASFSEMPVSITYGRQDDQTTAQLDALQLRRWVAGIQPLPGADAAAFYHQVPARLQAADYAGHAGLAMAMLDIEGWRQAAVDRNIDEQESRMRLLIERAKSGLRDLAMSRSVEYYAVERQKRRQDARWDPEPWRDAQ